MLNCRIEGGRDPIRIIADSHLRIPMDSQLVRTAGQQPLIVACLPDADEEKAAQLQEKECGSITDSGSNDSGYNRRTKRSDFPAGSDEGTWGT
ncbi:MAG: hypothetical protein ACLTS6_15825 [Anaerobutyricum sp.]